MSTGREPGLRKAGLRKAGSSTSASAGTTKAYVDAADAALAALISAEASARGSAVTSEASTRSSADSTEATARAAGDALALAKASNLSDLANASTARSNLGLGSTMVALAELLGSEIPTAGTNLGDANATITIAGGAQYVLPAATLTANRVLTLGVTGSPLTGETIAILRRGTEAFTLTIQDDAATSLLVMPVSTRMAAYFRYDGTHFVLSSAIRIQ